MPHLMGVAVTLLQIHGGRPPAMWSLFGIEVFQKSQAVPIHLERVRRDHKEAKFQSNR